MTMLLVPHGRTTLPRTSFGSRIEIMRRLLEAGFEVGEDPIFFEGVSLQPNIDLAIRGYILVVPDSSLTDGRRCRWPIDGGWTSFLQKREGMDISYDAGGGTPRAGEDRLEAWRCSCEKSADRPIPYLQDVWASSDGRW